jgi:hypothetical protein
MHTAFSFLIQKLWPTRRDEEGESRRRTPDLCVIYICQHHVLSLPSFQLSVPGERCPPDLALLFP